ncbi:MAG: branched-chain amino acid transport system II carrier protein [Alphaproteobacteria bacterium]|nr:branched-chain amino acid transport system II carrier protein [Alphaproteobacteria bacterium]
MIWNNHKIRLAALIVSTGFAMFAMFFGSGNLVFPLLVGQLVGDNYGPAMIGFVLTGVTVPFLGLLGVLLYEGSYKKFLSIWGSSLGFILALFMLTLLGPLGVVPRCMTVSYGSFSVIFDSVPAVYFNLVMALVIYVLCLNQNRIVTILGAFLAPLKITSVFIIIVYGVIYANQPSHSPFSALGACEEGIMKGYQTMDLLAAFFFASFMIRHIKQKTKQANLERYALKTSLYAMLVGAALLSFIYAGLVFLGATFADIFKSSSPEMYLSVIADHTLGSSASVFVSTTIILSCLTTAIALTTVFTEFIRDYVLKGCFSWQVCLGASVLSAYAISILGFSSIATFLGPILSVLYPGLIVLTLSNLLLWARRKRIQHKIQLKESQEQV